MPKKTTGQKKTAQEPRQLKARTYRSFRLQKPVKKPGTNKLPGAFKLFFASLRMLRENWKLFGGILLVNGLLNIVFVQGLNLIGTSADLGESKTALEDASSGQWGRLVSGLVLFSYLAGSSGGADSDAAAIYQMLLAIITSLALIWTLRELYAGNKVRIRDGFYRGMHPLVPYILVLCVVALQLIPVLLGGFLYGLVSAGNISLGGVEALFWLVVFGLSALISVYMLCSSLFALYIVSLPDMTPMAALRSARELVRYRRWTIIRKIVFLPVALLVCAAAVTIPVIFLATPVAGFVFFLLSMIALGAVHSYMYRLYRELL
jgi:hypothetical protein